MGSFNRIIYQIIFGPKYRGPCLKADKRDELFKYISGILKNKKCHLYQIGGVEDHIHILTHIHPEVSLASLVKVIKVASNIFISENKLFKKFTNWQEGYGAFTYSEKDLERLIPYVANQVEHHKTKTFREEFIELLIEHNIEFDERYLL